MSLEFVRSGIARCAAENPSEVANYAIRRWGKNTSVVPMLKAAVAGGNTSGGWGSELAGQRVAETSFLEKAESPTAFGRLEQWFRKVRPLVPYCATAEAASAAWRAQGRAAPVSALAFRRQTMSSPYSLTALIVESNTLLRDESNEAETLIATDITTAARNLIDATFFDHENAGTPGLSPPGINYGGIQFASTGSLADDLNAALGAFRGNLQTTAIVMPSRTAVNIGIRSGGRGLGADLGALGGTLAGLPVFVTGGIDIDSDGVSSITLIDGSGVVVVDEGASLTRSDQATIEMTDNPAGASDTPTAAASHFVSMFQADSTALLYSRYLNWDLAREGGCVTITGANYPAVS